MLLLLETIFLQGKAASGGNPMMYQLFLIFGILIVFYFFMIRPQQKKQKAQAQFREGLKKGDKVVTIGGLHGTIAQVEGDVLTLEVGEGKSMKLKFDVNSVSVDATRKIGANN
ncbi:preprotein translocase subunit YajC [uncultured Microscilla sp.]|uniref:preprotein translocase subunit YajC n=1 Tax=uncultured Microscilla sp. TaxID=432653 RepID=UPI0026219988|nr:preprotein translocase subunit YajC [uncultured Microscilla sp.]